MVCRHPGRRKPRVATFPTTWGRGKSPDLAKENMRRAKAGAQLPGESARRGGSEISLAPGSVNIHSESVPGFVPGPKRTSFSSCVQPWRGAGPPKARKPRTSILEVRGVFCDDFVINSTSPSSSFLLQHPEPKKTPTWNQTGVKHEPCKFIRWKPKWNQAETQQVHINTVRYIENQCGVKVGPSLAVSSPCCPATITPGPTMETVATATPFVT